MISGAILFAAKMISENPVAFLISIFLSFPMLTVWHPICCLKQKGIPQSVRTLCWVHIAIVLLEYFASPFVPEDLGVLFLMVTPVFSVICIICFVVSYRSRRREQRESIG